MQKQLLAPSPPESGGKRSSKFGLQFIAKSVVDGKVQRARPILLIDEEPIDEHLPIDLHALIKGLARSGRHYIYTCGCGDAGCAGVEEGVRVGHRLGTVIWEYRLPQSTVGFGSDWSSRYESWLRGSTFHRHFFERKQVVKAVFEALSDAEATHADDAEYAPYGFERRHITELLAAVAKIR